MNARYCTACGAELAEGASFCAACGASVQAGAATRCRSCGADLAEGASFCSSCGAAVPGAARAAPAGAEAVEYPVTVTVEYPERLSRLLIFVKWLLAIPHLFVLIFYGIAVWFAAIGAWFAILFTGNQPRGLFDFIVGFDRWALRAGSYVGLLTDQYPPFTNQPGAYPVELHVEYPDQLSRGLIFIKWLLAIPHWIILVFYALAAGVVTIIAWFAILFTARYPQGLFEFVVGLLRWEMRVIAYQGIGTYYNPYVGGLLTDKYPPFSNR
jgi:hypothetical protein